MNKDIFRVTIPSVTWLGNRSAPSQTRIVTSKNYKLAVHAAYMKIAREKSIICYSHDWREAKVENISTGQIWKPVKKATTGLDLFKKCIGI